VTLANNQAGQFGGGIYHFGRYAILNYVTIGDNTAGAAGNAIYEDSPMSGANPGVVQIANSVIFGAANNCDGGLFQSLGHNISKGSCAALSAATDQENIAGNLLLGAWTVQRRRGGDADHAAAGEQPADRRGRRLRRQSAGSARHPRPYGAACDVGAVEVTASDATQALHLPLVVR
jgi:hypothetical protein